MQGFSGKTHGLFLYEDDFNAFEEAGGHTDKCPSVCSNAACWLIEIIAEENLIKEVARFPAKVARIVKQ